MTTPNLPPTPVNPAWLLPGTRVGAYVVRRALSRGGGQMAYLAEGPRRRPVVLKMSLFPKGERDSESRMMHQRFLRQVAFFLELDGVPGIARTSAYGMYPDSSHDGHLYMVQEWVPRSRTIVDWSGEESHPLNIVVCGWVMLAAACGEMGRKGICHRDLKADNVLMTPRGVPKVVDFNSGIGPGAERLTWPSARCVPGTPASYCPEHCEAILEEYATRRPIPFQYQPTGDLHALGVIFYEVLTGQHPFHHAKGEALYELIARQMPERPRVLNPEVPFGLEKVTMKLLQKNPEQRYQSGDQVALELEALFATGEDWSRPFRTPRRSRQPSPSRTTRHPRATRTRMHAPASAGASALPLPTAIVRAGPRAIVVQGPLGLARAPGAPAHLVPGATIDAPAHGPRKRRLAVAVALLAVAVAGAVAIALPLGRGAVLGRAKRAAVTDDAAWLASCSPEERETVRELGLDPDHGEAWLEDGANVITHEDFAEVHNGPFEATVSVGAGFQEMDGTLIGDIRAGSDGASLRFTRLKLEDGRVLPICAYGADNRDPDTPGVRRAGLALHHGYLPIATGRLVLHFAH